MAALASSLVDGLGWIGESQQMTPIVSGSETIGARVPEGDRA